MKKRWIALFLIMLLLLCSGCRKATLEGYKLFRSTPLGFSMEYPNFWNKDAKVKDGIAAFVTPLEGYSDQYAESLSVQRFVPDVEGEDAFNKYVTGYVENLQSTIRNFKLVSEASAKLGEEEAYKIVYESTSEDQKDEVRFMQVFAAHGDHFYVVTYIAEFSSYSYFLTYVEKMLSTFTFI